jgi:hypothetical protein
MEGSMCALGKAAIFCFGLAGALFATAAPAQIVKSVATIALKSGENAEVGVLYFVSNCQSLLTKTPEVEILDGPPGVTAAVRDDMVLPRAQRCANKVKGGTLIIAAKNIEDPSFGELTIRVTYHTRDGERKFSTIYNISLFP